MSSDHSSPELIEANQDDRNIAARWCGYGPVTNDRIRAGECDYLPGVQAIARHRLASIEASGLDEVVEVLGWFNQHRESIETDIRSAHHARGQGASSFMVEDDRDFRRDLSAAFGRLAAALAKVQKP